MKKLNQKVGIIVRFYYEINWFWNLNQLNLTFEIRIRICFIAKSAKSTKSAKSVKSELKDDAKSDITDGNNTSAAETTIPLDDDAGKSNGNLSTKSGNYSSL